MGKDTSPTSGKTGLLGRVGRRFGRLGMPTKVASIGVPVILVAGLVTITGRTGSNAAASEHASTTGTTSLSGTTSSVTSVSDFVQQCIDAWNATPDAYGSNDKAILEMLQRGSHTIYVSVGSSQDFADRCLVTVADPDVGSSQQFMQQSNGSFNLSFSGRVSDLPDSVTQWNASADAQGNLSPNG